MSIIRELKRAEATANGWRWGSVEDDWPHCDYEDLFTSRGLTIEVGRTFGSYQGDIAMVLGDGQGRFAATVFGYGSCSGCDALEACDSWDEIEAMADQMTSGLEWRETRSEIYQELHDALVGDKGLNWYYHDEEYTTWVEGDLKVWAEAEAGRTGVGG